MIHNVRVADAFYVVIARRLGIAVVPQALSPAQASVMQKVDVVSDSARLCSGCRSPTLLGSLPVRLAEALV